MKWKRERSKSKKTQTIFEIPLPTKDPELVEEVIKVLIGHIESKMNTKVDGLYTLKNQPKIVRTKNLTRDFRYGILKKG